MTIAHLVSPPFSCGVAWLVNVLIELNIKTTNASFEPGHWDDQGVQSSISEAALDHLRWHLPALHHKHSFEFEQNLEVIWEHRLTFPRVAEGPVILFVRDPRDAIYSMYKRNYVDAFTYLEYLRRPDIWPQHFPGLFKLPPADTYAYFCLLWMAMAKTMNVNVVRFEDMRADPVTVVKGILSILGSEREEKEIERALEASTFEKARVAMQACEKDTGRQFLTARQGNVYEWRKTHSNEELDCMEGPASYLMHKLGYVITSTRDYYKVEEAVEKALTSLPDILQAVLDKIQRLERYGDQDMLQKSIIATGKTFSQTGMERVWIATFLQSFDWVNLIFPMEKENQLQRNTAFRTFCALNRFFLGMPTIYDAMQDVFRTLDVRESLESKV